MQPFITPPSTTPALARLSGEKYLNENMCYEEFFLIHLQSSSLVRKVKYDPLSVRLSHLVIMVIDLGVIFSWVLPSDIALFLILTWE